MTRWILGLILAVPFGTAVAAAPPAPPDWLIQPGSFKAQVREEKGELILDNGLARRTIQLKPDAATIALDNLITGESLLRAVGPEARITINGTAFQIGGLQGQPVKNYLKADWLPTLRALPEAYHFQSWRDEAITARFPWKKRSEWLARDLPWPPPGRHVILTFSPPPAAPGAATGPVLLEDRFAGDLDPAWKVHVSNKNPQSSFAAGGKAGEIVALSDACVYAERPWPKDGAMVEITVSGTAGDRRSNSWGPGLAVVAGSQVASLVARPGSGQFEIVDPERGEILAGRFDRAKPARLRARLEQGQVAFEASQDGGKTFARIGAVPFTAQPTALRIGKIGKGGRGVDYATASGEPVKCRVSDLTIRGPELKQSLAPRKDLPIVEVHYEIYDGLPLFCKWLVVRNDTKTPIRVNEFISEELRLAEVESTVESAPDRERPNLWVETDYAFGAMDAPHAAAKSVHLDIDPDYPTQVNYDRKTPCLLRTKPPLGPDQEVPPGGGFESFRAFELLLDSSDRERRGLAQRRMYRTIAPWTAENPLMFHVRRADPATIRSAITQCSEVGFEMIIMSFGSGFNFESRDPRYQERYKTLSAEAKEKGLALGGYSLLASRGAADKRDNTQGQPAMYGVMPCLGSKWGMSHLDQLKQFARTAGFGVLEHDGSYPGDRCASTDHPGHRGLADSQWVQWRAITDLYKTCRAEGIYLNIPDWYFLMGGNKCGMGYRESNWSLPRAEQELVERQNIFDGTWTKTASMGWMMVPLTEYQGGGAAATIEPLSQHLPHYESRLANLLGAGGAQACYRGPRLYDTDETKALVKKWVAFYKAHREVLDGDLIHLRRADGRDWDGWLHVDPQGKEKGIAFFYNPLPTAIERDIRVPLRYTGLSESARMSIEGGPPTPIDLDRSETATIRVKIPAQGRTWVAFTSKSEK